ncbi:MAG: sulfur carrier protein ThiS [Planctomycetota bacterium]
MDEQPQISESGTMRVTVNGEPKQLPADATVTSLLARLKLTPNQVAVEVNKRLRRAADYDRPLADGDTIELVTFVGGG